MSVKIDPPLPSGFSVAGNGVSSVSASATVGDRGVTAVSTGSFSFPLLWLVLVISIVLFFLQILMSLVKTVARWEQPFNLIIIGVTLVALVVEIIYMINAFRGPETLLLSFSTSNLPLDHPVDATLNPSSGPSFGFWLGPLATIIVGGVGVVKVVGARRKKLAPAA